MFYQQDKYGIVVTLSRFEKLAARYFGFLSFGATLIWLR